MNQRALVVAAVLGCLGLPAAAILVDAARHFAANRASGTLVVAGKERDYIVHVPRSYDPARPTPLVVSLHPALGWGAFQMNVSQWNRVADAHGFIVAYPSGEGGGPRMWSMRGSRNPARMPDVLFIAAMIDTLEARYNIDRARIYANGFSNGGGMSFVLSCTLSRRIAAIGAVAAAQTVPWAWCPDRKAVPMIAFHGTGDLFTPYQGGKSFVAEDAFPSIPDWTSKWAARNGCSPTPTDSAIASDVSLRRYPGCAAGADVELYTLQGGGHTWPGGLPLSEWMLGPTSHSIDASEVMWAFFQAHQLATKP